MFATIGLSSAEDQLSEDLSSAISVAEQDLSSSSLVSSEELYENANALSEVYELMLSESIETVTILNLSYTQSSLSSYIAELTEAASEQAEIELAVLAAESILNSADDLDSDDLSSYAEELFEVADLMESDDLAVINGVEYTLAGVLDLAETALDSVSDPALFEDLLEDIEIASLVAEIEEALQADSSTDQGGAELEEDLAALIDILDPSEEVVIDGEAMDADDLEVLLGEIEQEAIAEQAEHEEEVQAAVDEAELALGDGSTSELLFSYVQALEELVGVMQDTDIVTIDGEDYSEDGVEQLIVTTTAQAEALYAAESQAEAVASVELALAQGTDTAADTEALIVAYQALLPLLAQGETVEIDGEDMTASDIESEIDQLEEIAEAEKAEELAAEQLEQADLDAIAQDIENYVAGYEDEDGVSYITAELLEEELELWEDLERELGEGESVVVLGEVYTEDNIDEKIELIESTLDYIENNDFVIMNDNGVVSYIDEEEFLEAQELEEEIREAEVLMNLEDPTPQDLEDTADELSDVLGLMDEEDTNDVVIINKIFYTYSMLVNLINQYESEAETLADQSEMDAEAQDITDLLQSSNEVTTEEELDELIEEWTDLVDLMGYSDIVWVDGEAYTLSEAEGELDDLETRKSNLDDGQVEVTSASGSITITTAQVTESTSVSSETYEDMIESSTTFIESAPVLSTATSVAEMSTDSGTPITKISQTSPGIVSSTSGTFLQVTAVVNAALDRDESEAPVDPPILGEEYIVGDTNYIIVTTYIPNTSGTGKIYVFPSDDLMSYINLIQGLEVPTGSCFDKNHNFLYVTDQGNATGSGAIYQYQIYWDSNDFELSNGIMVEIYNTGNPSDCKVDGYGNLFFTDAFLNTINFVEYSDLYFGYVNMNAILYSSDATTIGLDTPVAIEVVDSDYIYYANNGDGATAGTLNKAEAGVVVTNDEPIDVVVTESVAAWGMAYTGERIYYSLDNGDLKAYEIEGQSVTVYSSGYFIEPRGLCYGENKVFIADYGAGILYSIKDGSMNTPNIMVYLQAVNSCYCVNESSGKWIGAAVAVVISIIS